MRCPSCRSEFVSDSTKVCPECGFDVQQESAFEDNDSLRTLPESASILSSQTLAEPPPEDSSATVLSDDFVVTDSDTANTSGTIASDDSSGVAKLKDAEHAEDRIAGQSELSKLEPSKPVRNGISGSDSLDADQTFLSDEWPEHEPSPGEVTVELGSPAPPPTASRDLRTLEDTTPKFSGDTSVDATFISDEWPEHEGVEPGRKTRAESAISDAGSGEADQTLQSDDPSHAGESSGFVVVTRGGSSQHGQDSSQTFISDAPLDEEMRTLASNFGDIEGDQPSQTLKSGEESVRGSHQQSGATLDTVPRRSMRSGETPHIARPDYDLIKILGEGGMGVVWDARQTSVDRSVAVKMIKGPAASNKAQQQKFLAEAVVTGDLDHPNIVPIYDVGTDDKGILFYSMKQVHGTPWLKVIKSKSLHENLEILLRTADAVAFAHSRGIIHRDLKPENVMLGSFGETLVMDWGLALPTRQFSKGRDVVQPGMGGTPAYMAPEMATGPLDRITFASDIYLLGAILFELITGKPPHPGKKVQECLLNAMRNVITQTDVTGELMEIALKSMATLATDRFGTVQEFQSAIREYLSHSESIAMSVRAAEDLKIARETKEYTAFNKAMFGFEEALELWTDNSQARTGLDEARLAYAEDALGKGDYDLGLSLVQGSAAEQIELRTRLRSAQEEREARQRRLAAAKRIMGVMAAAIFLIVSVSFVLIRSERNFAITQRDKAIEQEDIANKQKAIAVKERDNAQIQERIANEQRVIATRERDNAQMQERIAIHQKMLADEQRTIATKERDNAKMQEKIAEQQRDEAKKQEMRALVQKQLADEQRQVAEDRRQEADQQRALAVSAREAEEYETYIARIGLAAAKIDENAFDVARDILSRCKPELRNWEWGRLMYLCSQASREFRVGGPVESIAISRDGKSVAAASWDRRARVWDLSTGKIQFEIPHDGLYVHSVAWSPDGKVIATGGSSKGNPLNLWNAENGKLLTTLPGHSDAVVSVVFSDSGQWLLSCSYDNTARLWDLRDSAKPVEAAVLREHTWWVWDGAFSPGFDPSSEKSARIVTVSQDGKAIVWKVNSDSASIKAEMHGLLTQHEGPVYGVAFHPNGGQVATAGYDRRILLWNPDTVPKFRFGSDLESPVKVTELEGHTAPVQSVSFSSDGALIVSGSRDNAVKVWNVEQARAIKTLRGHDSAVRSAALTPDGRTIVSGGQDQRVLEWTVDGYEEFRTLQGRTLQGHGDAILSASFSPDGSEIVTASRDRTARSWEVQTGKPIHTFREGHDYLASNALFFRDGRTLITSAADNTVRFWDVASGTQFLRLSATGRSAAIALSSDDRWLVTGAESEFAQLWDLNEIARDGDANAAVPLPAVRRLEGHHGRVTAVGFSPRESLLATADSNGRCILRRIAENGSDTILWNVRHHTRRVTAVRFLDTGEILTASSDHSVARIDPSTGSENTRLVLKHEGAVSDLDVSPDGNRIATVSEIGGTSQLLKEGSRITIFETGSAQPISTLDVVDFSVMSVDFLENGKAVLAACSDNSVRIIEPGDRSSVGTPLINFQERGGIVWSARFTQDYRSIVTIGGSDARLWDLATGRESMTFSPHGAIASARFSPDGRQIVTGSWDNSARVWDATTGQALLKLEQGHSGYINSTAFSPSGKQILTASDDGTAKLWDSETGQILVTYSGHKDRVRSATFSRDGSQVLTTSNDKTARLWDTATGQQSGEPFTGHLWAVLCGQFSPDGKRLLTGGEDNEARIWDIATRRSLSVLKGHTAAVTSVAYSVDGERVFTASQDNTAKLWDASSGHEGKEILTLKGHQQEVTSVTFSPDGRQVLTASRDGKAIVWLTRDWTTEPGAAVTNVVHEGLFRREGPTLPRSVDGQR